MVSEEKKTQKLTNIDKLTRLECAKILQKKFGVSVSVLARHVCRQLTEREIERDGRVEDRRCSFYSVCPSTD